jgi:cytochrome c
MRIAIRILILALVLAPAAYLGAQSKSSKAAEKKPNGKEPAGSVAKGKTAYADFCSVCHYAANTSKKIGPGLKGIYKTGKFADGKKVDDESMREWILKGGKDMPSFEGQLSDAQTRDLIAYLKTI